MNLPFSFPVTLEAFIAYQTELAGCTPTAKVKALIEAWLPVINDAYEDGLKGDSDSLKRDLVLLEGFIKKHEGLDGVIHFIEATRYWLAEAWDHGHKAQKKEEEGFLND